MTKEETRQLFELQVKFEKRCEEVCSILKDLDVDYGNLNYFIMCENEVFAIGNNYDYEEITLVFPASLLTSDDDVIREYVKNEKRRQEEESQRLNDLLEAKKREEEIALLNKLKAKYE